MDGLRTIIVWNTYKDTDSADVDSVVVGVEYIQIYPPATLDVVLVEIYRQIYFHASTHTCTIFIRNSIVVSDRFLCV